MNNKMIETNWAEIKGAIKLNWGKFSNADIDALKGDLGLLVGRIQKIYGISKESADRQFDDFKLSVQVLIGREALPKSAAESRNASARPLLLNPHSVMTPATQVSGPVTLKNIKIA